MTTLEIIPNLTEEEKQLHFATIEKMKKDGPALYVGTYGKYAAGSIDGAWLYLDNYADPYEFMVACKQLHSDDADPEFMFQDYMDLPSSLYKECLTMDDLIAIYEFLELEEHEREAVQVYVDQIADNDKDYILEAFNGVWDSEEHFATHLLENTGDLDTIPEHLQHYFDYDAFTRDLFMWDYTSADVQGGVMIFRQF